MNHLMDHGLSIFDVSSVRQRFGSIRGGDTAYFDAPAGSQVPDEVGQAIAQQMRDSAGNILGPFRTSAVLSDLMVEARAKSAEFFGGEADNVCFGGSMTSMNFELSRAATRDFVAGDEIIVTALDHEGNVAPWREAALDRDLVVRVCDATADMRIDIDHLRSLVTERTRVVAFPLASNTTGSLTDALEISSIAHEVGAISWVDAVHYAAHERMDVAAIRADVMLCSAYKFFGPHVSIAHIAPQAAATWRAYNVINRDDFPLGARFENGAPAFEQIAGLLATFDYLKSIGGFDSIRPYERGLAERLLGQLPEGVVVHGPDLAYRVPTLLTTVEGVSGMEVARRLAGLGIFVLPHDFSYEIGLKQRFDSVLRPFRIGITHYNTAEEVDRLSAALEDSVAKP
ncbi:MAG: aminotransferase class V-fold PLP-dependent enzyme [Propionibacteriaceae bacterium]|nr:aminotransferase class V-fold PLP-dependent enzyme [Propionibacteriaceae bacterium]